ncbi:hypothetical protein [Mycolicibacterium iranicum]|uniref:TetR family transcriptional regulator n=1 Tax=Mycolicibacterium iranicum TaxID=912594 RepID=A0ABT4HR41_MYCIR|nr:hypothetical protein [Mycolicibacterium iranicum]MCZ0732209.1 hypothetical protein [Mycolicibacterium iranicum]
MSEDSDVLDSEYRELVRQLHPQTISVVVDVNIWWMQVLFREVSMFTASVFDSDFDDEKVRERANELQHELQNDVERKLNTLAFGHPDPDVRRAAQAMTDHLFGVIFYYDGMHAKRKDGREATTAIRQAHSGMVELRRAAYHAPFRTSRPTPDYDGVGERQPLPSSITQ